MRKTRDKKNMGGPVTNSPHFPEGEAAIIGACLLNNDVIPNVMNILQPGDFYSIVYRQTFEAITDIYLHQAVDFTTITAWLKDRGLLDAAGGTSNLIDLIDAVPSVANIQHYINLVKDKSLRRQFIIACKEAIIEAGSDGELCLAISTLQTNCLPLVVTDKKQGLQGFNKANREVFRVVQENFSQQKEPGVKTGFNWLDSETGGMRPGELWVVCARPGMGKSAWAINVATNVAKDGALVFLFSLEMQNEAIWGRMISRQSGVPFWLIRNIGFDRQQFGKIVTAVGDLDDIALWIDDSPGLTPSEVLFRTQKIALEQKKQPSLIIIDYLQIMMADEGNHHNREREVASMSAAAKRMAKQTNCPVMILSQLNREVSRRTNQRPQLSDLRESGAIEQDADVVIGIYRKWPLEQIEENKTHAEIGILKQRNGPIGWDTDVEWNPHTVSFSDKLSNNTHNPRPFHEPKDNMEAM